MVLKKKKKVLLMSRCFGKKRLLFYKAMLVWRGGPCPKDTEPWGTSMGRNHCKREGLTQGHAKNLLLEKIRSFWVGLAVSRVGFARRGLGV